MVCRPMQRRICLETNKSASAAEDCDSASGQVKCGPMAGRARGRSFQLPSRRWRSRPWLSIEWRDHQTSALEVLSYPDLGQALQQKIAELAPKTPMMSAILKFIFPLGDEKKCESKRQTDKGFHKDQTCLGVLPGSYHPIL